MRSSYGSRIVPAERPQRQHLAGRDVDVGDLGHEAVDVVVPLEQPAQRDRDLTLGQDPRGALVEQRLEQMVRGPVDDGDLDRPVPQLPGGEQAGEAAADDHHAPRDDVVDDVLVHQAQPAGSCQVWPSGSNRSASSGPQLPRAYGWTGTTGPSTGSTTRQAASTVCCWANSHRSPGQGRADEPVVRAHVGSGLLREGEVLSLRDPARSRLLADEGEPDLALRPDAEPQHVRLEGLARVEDVMG